MKIKKPMKFKPNKKYGKMLKELSKTKEEKEDDLVNNALVDEDLAINIFK